MPRILHVLSPARFGGLERVVASLASGQRAMGCDVSAAALIGAHELDPPVLSELRDAGVDVRPIETRPRAYRAQLRALLEVCAAVDPDVVHSHGYAADVFVALPRKQPMPPMVTTVHGFTGGGRRNRMYEWMQRLAFRRFDAVVAVSARLGRELIEGGLGADQVHVIPNAYAPAGEPLPPTRARSMLGVPLDAFSIGWIGRVSHEKGLDTLIDALPALAIPEWHLTVLGDGSERTGLEARAARVGVGGRVTWRGMVNRASDYVRAFDVLVISSRTEGTPITLFEAMSGHVPVVTTAVGGIPDVVSSAEAILVSAEDPAALANAIAGVYGEPSAAGERAARAAARLGRQFAMNTFLSSYDHVYRGVQGKRALRGK